MHITFSLLLASPQAWAQNFTVPAALPPTGTTQQDVDRLLADAKAAYETNAHQRALARLLDVYTIKPTIKLLLNFGLVYEGQGDFRSARECYQRYLDLTTFQKGSSGSVSNSGLSPEAPDRDRFRIKIEEIEKSYPYIINRYPPAYCIHTFVLPEQADGKRGESTMVRLIGPPDRSISPVLLVRAKGQQIYSKLNFKINNGAPSEWIATIPTELTAGGSVQYYVEFLDIEGKRITPNFQADSVAQASRTVVTPFHTDYEPGQIAFDDPSKPAQPQSGPDIEVFPRVETWSGSEHKVDLAPTELPKQITAVKTVRSAPWSRRKIAGAVFAAAGLASLGAGVSLVALSVQELNAVVQNAGCDGFANQTWVDGVAVCPHFGKNQLANYNRALPQPSAERYQHILPYRAAGITALVIGAAAAATGTTFLLVSNERRSKQGRVLSKRLSNVAWRVEPVLEPHAAGFTSLINF